MNYNDKNLLLNGIIIGTKINALIACLTEEQRQTYRDNIEKEIEVVKTALAKDLSVEEWNSVEASLKLGF